MADGWSARLLGPIDRMRGWALIGGVGLGLLALPLLLRGGPALVGVGLLLLGAAALGFGGEPLALEGRAPAEGSARAVEATAIGPGPDVVPASEAVPARPWKAIEEPLRMIEIPGGTFLMGSLEREEGRRASEGPVHQVTVSPFAMAEVPVTQRLYREVTGDSPGRPEGDDLPVNYLDWRRAVLFCNRLSDRVGLTPCYRISDDAVEWDRGADGYRLPTEAEWEYACRAGQATRFSFGDDASRLGEFAWYDGNAKGPMQVGQKPGNRFGLRDMHGNVWEWCWDRYGRYNDRRETDPVGPPSGHYRVLRGGSFGFEPGDLRSALRNWFLPVGRLEYVGFRCVRGARLQP